MEDLQRLGNSSNLEIFLALGYPITDAQIVRYYIVDHIKRTVLWLEPTSPVHPEVSLNELSFLRERFFSAYG